MRRGPRSCPSCRAATSGRRLARAIRGRCSSASRSSSNVSGAADVSAAPVRLSSAMRPVLLLTAIVSLVTATAAQGPQAIIDSQAFLDANSSALPPLPAEETRRIDQLLRQMTLAEKVGQMTQLEIGMITDGQEESLRVNPDKLRRAVVDYGAGGLLNVKDLALPVAKWHEIIRAIQASAAQTRLKIPVIYGLDTIHGANYVAGATMFPQPLGMAATWNPQLMLEGSRIAAAETRAAGVPWNFSPVVDIGRQPLWPRLY